ncbi:hypothetical protein [Sulfuricurvum sp.]|uniref:hypothetical protein n=1 Tax=Sulfuricurvum sp. TaxID=2025608 RepID=UPI003BB01093
MPDKSQIAIYISLGSLAISALSFFFSLRQSRIAKKNERIRVYDKVYHDASDLLLYHYQSTQAKPYVNEDKDLEIAVNEYASAHWLEQMYGINFSLPNSLTTEEEKQNFSKKVREEYYAHEDKKQESIFEEFINYQSPIFHLENEEFSNRFSRLMAHINENLSYFSPIIKENWEKTRLLTPDKVKNEYLALKRVNEQACEAIEESIDDPYLQILLSIRHEYRELNKPLKTKWSEFFRS